MTDKQIPMRERIARALVKKLYGKLDYEEEELLVERYIQSLADAALEAMSDPTPEMVEAMAWAWDENYRKTHVLEEVLVKCFEAAIETARKG